MRKVYISEARCSSPLLRTSKPYRLHFTILPPATVVGLRSPKSKYIKAAQDSVAWKDPFGGGFTVILATIDCRVAIDFRERHLGHSGRILASCNLDLSATDKEICLDLKSDANDTFGELTICVTSSLVSTRDAVHSAGRAAGQLGPGIATVNDAIEGTATEITVQVTAWHPLLSRLDALLKVADIVAEVHPWIKLAWGIVSAAYKIASAQSARDAKVMGLVQTMADSCSFADQAEDLKKRSKTDQDIINQILRQVMECAYFIRDYCNKSFVKRAVGNTVSPMDAWIDNYKGTLETLRRNLVDHANIQCSVITHRVLDVVTEVRNLQVLSEIKYAPEAHHDLDKACLSGTRTEIIDAIVGWAVGADLPSSDPSRQIKLNCNESSRVLWLCGTAGAGKSSILRSCAKRISDLERKGSYYGFDKNKPLANLTNLFGTIARDLADLDNSRKQRLVDAVKNDTAIRTTDNCKLQFQHFIIASFKDDKALGETVVFIDAFDGSGDVAARADALAILTKRASELPPGLRVVVTSRYEPDIQVALQSPLQPGLAVMLVDDIPAHQTSRDIGKYVHNEFHEAKVFREKYSTQLRDLIRMAGTSFQWAATACRFICGDNKAGVGPQDRIGTVLRSDEGLYGLYSTVMKAHCDPSIEIGVKRVKSILGRIVCAQEPLSLQALIHLVPPDSILTPEDPDDKEIQRGIVKHLGSLLSGTHSDDEPIVPLHASYRDFLCDPKHNQDFCIDKDEANQHMALACFRVMEQSLKFNICQLPTSFLPNVAIPNITVLLKEHIPSHLSYACQFWSFHVSSTPSSNIAQKHTESFFWNHFLHWLEVMSLTQSSPQIALAPLVGSHIALDIVELQHDAMQFISMFKAVIATSVPHIYLSGLTFAPASSLLYQRWQGQFPGVAKLAQGQLQHWPNIILILEGHHSIVQSVAFSPNGKHIASGSWDKTVRLWNAETGAIVGQPMEGHNDVIFSIAFSPDGKQIASGSRDKTIQLWNVEMGESVGQPMQGHNGAISSVPFSPDGKHIASGSHDRTIQLWSVETHMRVGQPMQGHSGAITSVAFSPDGNQIVSGSLDMSIQLWNVEIGVSVGQPMKGHNGAILSIAFSPDGKHIASGSSDETIQLWNVEIGARVGQPMMGHNGAISSIAFSPNGKQLASGSRDMTIQLWNVETCARVGQPMEEHAYPITSIAFSPDGKQIASGSWHKTIQLWNVETGGNARQPMKGHNAAILSIAFSCDGKQIVSGSRDNTIQLWNVEMGTSVGQPRGGGGWAIDSSALSPDGKQIASSSSGTIQLWNVETGASVGQAMRGHSQRVSPIAFSPDGKHIASGSRNNTIQLWNVETCATVGQPMDGHNNVISSIVFSPDSKQIASGSRDNTIQLWNVEMGARVGQPMEGHNQGISSIAFSPTGKQIASGSWDKTIRLWNVDTGASVGHPMEGHNDAILSIAFSPDGKWIASGSLDKTIQLWNVETCVSIGQPMEGHNDGVQSIAFSHDGKKIASGSSDKTIRLWNVEMGVNIGQEMEGNGGAIQSIASAPDSKQITYNSWDNTIQVSHLPNLGPKHILQYPVHLFPLPHHSFQFQNGWILGPSKELIIWVPAAYYGFLEQPNCHIMGGPQRTEIDFQHFKCGKEWVQCQELVGEADRLDNHI